jgi:site-specific recombinase XerD
VSVIHLNQKAIDRELYCPAGKKRIEYCDKDLPGLLVEFRERISSSPTYYVRYKDQRGKTNTVKLGRASHMTLADARREAKAHKAKVATGDDPRVRQRANEALPTLSTFFHDSYLPYVKPRKRSWKKDESLFRNRIDAAFGSMRLDQLQRQDLQAFHASLLDEGIAPATADHHLKLIRQVLNKAVEWEVIERNPIAKIKLFNPDNRLEHYLDPKELGRLLTVLRIDENRTACNVAMFLLATGARLNEALNARWEQIDRQQRSWRIPAANSKSKKARSVPLGDSALEVLDQLGTENTHDHLFVSAKTGARLSHIHRVWDRLRHQAHLPKLRLHDLRHQYASFLVNSGRSLYEVQKILGHSSHSVTERYAHLSSQSLLDAANTASVFIQEATHAE